MKKVLITGGCGFIGANLIARLRRKCDLEIVVLDNQSLGSEDHISEFDVTFISGDIRDGELLRGAMHGADTVIHLAAHTRVVESALDPTLNFETNVVGSFNVLRAAKDLGVSQLVNASTGGAILGEVAPPIHEEIPPRPLAPYGASKLAIEGYCSAFAASYGMNVVTLRFSNVYGPRSHHKGSVIAHFFKQILADAELVVYGDGSQVRDYVYVDDLCDGICRAMSLEEAGVFQLGTGVPTSVSELIEAIRATVGGEYPVRVRHEPFRAGEVRQTYCDITKARRVLGFEPKTMLREGLEKTWEWYLDHMPRAARSAPSLACN